MAEVNLAGAGFNQVETVTGNKTLDAGDSGVVQNVTATATITLPAAGATTAGITQIIRVGAPSITVTVSPNSADKIVGNGFTAADDKDLIFTSQEPGSFVQLMAVNEATTDSAWVIQRIHGTATREA